MPTRSVTKVVGSGPGPTLGRVRRRIGASGQALVLFAAAVVVLLGFIAVIIDVSWLWANSLRVQRAADAAALAGAIRLPGNAPAGIALALAEAKKNGYDAVAAGVHCPVAPGSLQICAQQDTHFSHRMDVSITAQVSTFFMRIFGINAVTVTKDAKAEFALPLPMGSPLNYYGVGCLDTNVLNGLAEPDCTQLGNSNGPSGVPDAQVGSPLTGKTAPSQLASQGAWGVVFTKGGDSRNGDAFAPFQVSTSSGSFVNNANAVYGGHDPIGGYDPAGYNYEVEIPPGGGGTVSIFDAGFCGMPTLGSGRAGTGDEWTTAAPGASNPNPVSTYYNLWQINDPYNPAGDTLVWSSYDTFLNMKQVDMSGAHGSGNPQYLPQGTPGGTNGVTRCDRPADPGYQYHLKWWQIPTGALAQGQYRLQVTTTKVLLPAVGSSGFGGGTTADPSQPSAIVGAANRFSLEVTSALGQPRVYGLGRMGTYANIQTGTQSFFLAQIDAATGASKTVEINLYDPGDVGGGSWLQILNPDNNVYTPATFTFTSVSKSSGLAGESSSTTITCIEANHPNNPPSGGIPSGCPANYDNSGSHFDNYWLTIDIPLPRTYGQSGLANNGWWKIQYTVGGGNDTTTWMVDILGNPVHLVTP
jgi:hypothetical protein